MVQCRLTHCQWNEEEIQGFSGLGRSAIGVLMRYLSISCLVTTDIIHHIEILQSHLERTERRTGLIPPLDVQCLSECALQGNGGLAIYKCLHTYNGLHHLGGEFISGAVTHLGGILHIDSNYWVSFIISSENSTVFLADSLHRAGTGTSRVMEEAMGILVWWLNTSYSGSMSQFMTPDQVTDHVTGQVTFHRPFPCLYMFIYVCLHMFGHLTFLGNRM